MFIVADLVSLSLHAQLTGGGKHSYIIHFALYVCANIDDSGETAPSLIGTCIQVQCAG